MNKENFSKLHRELVNLVAKYLKDKDLSSDAWYFMLTIDDLKELKKAGEWTPYNDSYMGVLNANHEEIIWEM